MLIALLAPALPVRGQAGPARTDPSTQLADGIVGRPLVEGTRVYFVRRDKRTNFTSITVHDSAAGTTLDLKRGQFEAESLAADGSLLAWIERSEGQTRVQSLDLATRRERTLLDGHAARRVAELALAGQTLVYTAHGTAGSGVFAHVLATGSVRRMAAAGSGLVAGGGHVLWSAAQAAARGSEWRLYLDRLDGAAPTVLARSTAPFGGYDVAHDAVVWSVLPPAADRRVWLHHLADGTSEPISTTPARFPRLGAGRAVWAVEVAGSGPPALESYGLGDGRRSRLSFDGAGSVRTGSAAGPSIATWGMLAGGRVVWTDEQADAGVQRRLWLSELPSAGDKMAGAVVGVSSRDRVQAARSLCGTPLTCGQLTVNGQYLYDRGGRWNVRGVQFFLPGFGINALTFYDRNYWTALDDVDGWLDIARNRLRARLLRIFIELPEGEWQPTSHETVYDFAQRAAARGMRLGVVVQNSGDFRMTPERRAWLDGLIAYFAERGATPLLAYISAANEINNWCSRQDCFDQSATYADAAIAWTSDVAATVKARAPGVLVTVGISSEVDDSDGLPAVYGYFRSDSSGRSLAGAIDFLAPHNYAGGAFGVFNDLRYTYGYDGPLVLEEFGWTTDPLSDDPRFTEGDPACIADPWTATCRNTGPYFVEWSLRALREVPYAGGVAWMLADVAQKDCASDPSDLWSGLFAAGEGYCGGTRSVTPLQGKATAARVAIFYGADDLSRLTYLPVVGR